jgi:Flp pilus assembly CpaF family ATPase
MIKKLVLDGREYRNLPGSTYYVSLDGEVLSVRKCHPDKGNSLRLVRKGHRVRRSAEQLVRAVWK